MKVIVNNLPDGVACTVKTGDFSYARIGSGEKLCVDYNAVTVVPDIAGASTLYCYNPDFIYTVYQGSSGNCFAYPAGNFKPYHCYFDGMVAGIPFFVIIAGLILLSKLKFS